MLLVEFICEYRGKIRFDYVFLSLMSVLLYNFQISKTVVEFLYRQIVLIWQPFGKAESSITANMLLYKADIK